MGRTAWFFVRKGAYIYRRLLVWDFNHVKRDVAICQKWYTTIGEDAPQHKIDQEIIKHVRWVAKSLKKEKWFNVDVAELLIIDLIEVAHADGEVIKNEQHAINMIARLWGVETPFMIHK